FVSIPHSRVIGAVPGIVGRLLIDWRTNSTIDDTIDVFPSQGVGGIVGLVITGVFAHSAINGAARSIGLYYGETDLFFAHIIGLIGSMVFILIMAFLLLKITDTITPLRVTEQEEEEGLDLSQHGERLSYDANN